MRDPTSNPAEACVGQLRGCILPVPRDFVMQQCPRRHQSLMVSLPYECVTAWNTGSPERARTRLVQLFQEETPPGSVREVGLNVVIKLSWPSGVSAGMNPWFLHQLAGEWGNRNVLGVLVLDFITESLCRSIVSLNWRSVN